MSQSQTEQDKKHEDVLECIVEKLIATGKYRKIETHVEYNCRGLNGELDIVATPFEGRKEYWEVKGQDNPASFKRAQVQFRRLEHAFPHKYAYFYATLTRVVQATPY